jgi:hypothetical protein
MQHSGQISRCVACDHQVRDANPRLPCPRCGSALLALPDELTDGRRLPGLATVLRTLRERRRRAVDG